MSDSIEVQDEGRAVAFSFDEMLRYSGPGSPGGVALGFKLLERALPLLDGGRPVERREVSVSTAFRGPGARDACELVTRALTDGRYLIDMDLERPERGPTLQSFSFRVSCRATMVSLILREGNVTDEFVAMASASDRTPEEDVRFAAMKQEVADLLMSRPATEAFEVE